MGNVIFKKVFEQQIIEFEKYFVDASKALFYDDKESKLIHPGEFGVYREEVCKNFLKFLIPENISIESGFIINPSEIISTQCDLVFYDKANTPVMRSREHQRFFPCETVMGIGEVKSKLTKSALSSTLIKLSKTKGLKDEIDNSAVKSLSGKSIPEFSSIENEIHRPFTIVICEELSFDTQYLVDELNELYEDVEDRHKHNMILSINDGLFLYADESDVNPIPYPYSLWKNNPAKHYWVHKSQIDQYIIFAQHLYNIATNVVTPEFNFYRYLLEGESGYTMEGLN